MGLDQFSYTVDSEGNRNEIAYWRKHPNLQGWMENLWDSKGRPNESAESNTMGLSEFNCTPVELSREDLDSLEEDITNKNMPQTAGFFFGDDSDDYYKEKDLEFIRSARSALDEGLKVYYDSWW